MKLIDVQNEVFCLARQGMSIRDISARLRRASKKWGQEHVPTAWICAWLHNAGLMHGGKVAKDKSSRNSNFNALKVKGEVYE